MALMPAAKRKPMYLARLAISSGLFSMVAATSVQAESLQVESAGSIAPRFFNMSDPLAGNTPQALSSASTGDAANGGADATEAYVYTFMQKEAETNAHLKALLDSATTDAEAAKLAGQLTPDRSGANIYNVLSAQNQFSQAIRKRTSDFLFGDSARSSMWVTYLSSDNKSVISSDGRNRYDGFDSTSSGFSFGYDQIMSTRSVLGIAFSQQKVESENRLYADKTLDIESFQASVYHTYLIDNYYLSSRAIAGWNANTAERKIGDDDVQSRFNSKNYALEFDLVRPIYWGNVAFLPLASVSYSYITVDSYSDTYAEDKDGNITAGSAAGLSYESQEYQELNFGLGLELAHTLYTSVGAIQSRVGFKADAETLDMDLTSSASLATGSDSFTVGVNERESVRYESYADVVWETNSSLTFSLGVQNSWDDSKENKMFFGRVVYSY